MLLVEVLSKIFLAVVKKLDDISYSTVCRRGLIIALIRFMTLDRSQNIFYLSSKRSLPWELKQITGVRWHYLRDKESLVAKLKEFEGDIFVVIHSDYVNSRTIYAFLSWLGINSKLSFIFIAKNIEKNSYQLALASPRILILLESEGERLKEAVTRCLRGETVITRKRERFRANNSVILQNSQVMPGLAQNNSDFLGSGQMLDFSRGGAQISVQMGTLRLKDYFILVYQDINGHSVAIEAQVRWLRAYGAEIERVGVQFIALSA